MAYVYHINLILQGRGAFFLFSIMWGLLYIFQLSEAFSYFRDEMGHFLFSRFSTTKNDKADHANEWDHKTYQRSKDKEKKRKKRAQISGETVQKFI